MGHVRRKREQNRFGLVRVLSIYIQRKLLYEHKTYIYYWTLYAYSKTQMILSLEKLTAYSMSHNNA